METLMKKSEDLSDVSVKFYVKAKKQNKKCCDVN